MLAGYQKANAIASVLSLIQLLCGYRPNSVHVPPQTPLLPQMLLGRRKALGLAHLMGT